MTDDNKIGVALFDKADVFSRNDNWACAFRGQPFEFTSASDLPSQTLWITNVELGDLFDAGLNRTPKIAHDAYFRTRMSQIVQELGIASFEPDRRAIMLAEILGAAVAMAKSQIGFTQYPSNALSGGIGQIYGYPDAPKDSVLLRIAERACQTYTPCERDRRHDNVEIFTFWMPRHELASSLIEQVVPSHENLRAVPMQSLPNNGKDARALVAWAKENSLPLFAQVKIHALEPTIGKLMNYGAGALGINSKTGDGSQFDSRNMREWCSLPELDELSIAGDIELQQVVCAGGWMTHGISLHNTKACSISYSYGLVAENIWVGLTRRPSGDNKISKNLGTAWMQGLDRMRCLRVAESLYNAGFEILNYGYGRITVACPRSVRALIPTIARELGLLYPASLGDLSHLPVRPQISRDVVQSLLATHDYPNMIRANQIAMNAVRGAASEA